MTRAEALAFLRKHTLCVVATASPSAVPQAAVVAFAVGDELEIVFDTVRSSRKVPNITKNAEVAIVVGWGPEEQTMQIQGIADLPAGPELERIKRIYFDARPDGAGRQAWEGITYVRVRPTWMRYSDFLAPGGGRIEEVDP
jgi:pyridoxine/pyridoxamine 5'-phosphate oxidase